MKNMVMYKKGEDSWITYIKSRIKQKLNFMAIAEGQTGVGKSWAMLSMAHMIDPEFTVEQVAFSFRDVMNIIVDPVFQKKKWKVILFDEAQTDINNRTWQSLSNKLMLYLTSTFRHQNIIFLMTSPYSDFMDSATMKLVHCKFIMKGVNRKTGLSNCRPKLQQYNGKMKKFYEHSLCVSSKKGTIKITNWGIKRPPKELVDKYEEKKTEFTTALNLDIKRQLDEAFEKAKGKRRSTEQEPDELKSLKPLTIKQRTALDLYNEYQDQKKVAEEMGISQTAVSKHLMGVEKKGYKVNKRGYA